ncbi:translation factor GTPase family protein [[Clostridium] polysaccharolyticum]|uniref:Small GTP-binding protein domain-containing protein n=1 Tax=[Clostridium] polysaccharolyticum TaxID=29364 RepID=A0A1I0DYZ7_9FIRM|nr:TetM/TetW/TetO/TetS family tetracycline resistance ribosomal protection protein [[Clostridium] polysaccharolyticum]SET37793.1 small GTP-binding protein domain-containing protein [[Clostridium] polysaccharolyticum]
MKKLVIGIVAHVDAGKTTLSESILYQTGSIRKLGRVDTKDAFLDTNELERARGITIFSKQAIVKYGDMELTLLDTPGHVDFSAEMERTLQVLDYAILVVSGADGVQGHTLTLWTLLRKYKVPAFIFVNKMDQKGTSRQNSLIELKKKLDENCIDFGEEGTENFYEEIAVCDEKLLSEYMEQGSIGKESIKEYIAKRKIFPCFFGSALKLTGVEEFLTGFDDYTQEPVYQEAFGARVFKITRDEQGNRLTHMKITGGSLKAKMLLTNKTAKTEEQDVWEEKVNQIRMYSGEKFEAVPEALAGCVCAVTGLTKTKPGEGFGIESGTWNPVLEPVLGYQLILPDGCDPAMMLPKLRQLEEEVPELHIVWDEFLQEIRVQIMGEVQTEILQTIIKQRFHVDVGFGTGKILYKETIADVVEGVGHFEPLRHYAEVHLLLEPLERGSGMQFEAKCSEDILDRNWQRLVMTHLMEKEHKGVLTGSPITDMKITLVTGRAHQKHTEGGDFRQATYRAVRQGLKQAQSVLLEPYYEFELEVPQQMVGRAMTDIDKMYGKCEITKSEGDMTTLDGEAPVATMWEYPKEVIAYTKGQGKLTCSLKGYGKCHNEQEVIEQIGYDSESDFVNPTGSVFCAHGSGFMVEWDQVKEYMHLESVLDGGNGTLIESEIRPVVSQYKEEQWIDTEEIDSILSKTFHANKKQETRNPFKKKKREEYQGPVTRSWKPSVKKEEYLLVDGYNIIFAWEELSELAKQTVDGARNKLMDILCNYQGMKKANVILVFDAYRVENHQTEIMDYHNIHVVYTKEAETADQYIEKFAHENASKYKITVATSDGLEQIIIRGKGCQLLSARELKEEVEMLEEKLRKDYMMPKMEGKMKLSDTLSEEALKEIAKFHKE